jgi:hypothetical protein
MGTTDRESDERASDEAALEQLAATVAVTDEILALVEDVRAPAGTKHGYESDRLLWLAFGRAFRCLRSIREVVAVHHDGDDALVLARALISLAFRSVWVAAPKDPDERQRLVHALELRSLDSMRIQMAKLAEAGIEHEPFQPGAQHRLDELRGYGERGMPGDETLAVELDNAGLNASAGVDHAALYARIYREASDVTHFSLFTALSGYVIPSGWEGVGDSFEGLTIRVHEGDPERAEEALMLACLVYVTFLTDSEAVIHHGIARNARSLLGDRLRSRDDPLADA